MRRSVVVIAVVVLGLASMFASSAQPVTSPQLPSTDRLPGVDLAEGLSQLTGVAISPLLGVSSVGAWRYYHASEPLRAALPWFCQPYVWGIGFCLLGLCFLKDLFGTAAPPLVKKPLDVLELFENKLSGLVACSAFLPFIVSQATQHFSTGQAALQGDLHVASVAGIDFEPRFLAIPLAIVAFLVVWLAGHAINVLIALCPFGLIDGMLKLFKTALLTTVVASAFIDTYLGAVVSLLVLFVAALLAPWAFRLTVFGTLFGFDVLLPTRARRLAQPTEPHAFLARPVAQAPVRTYGRLRRHSSGSVTFAYRPWLVFPERSVTIPPGNVAIGRGLLFPSLLHRIDPLQRHRLVVMFLPRYRSQEETIASHFAIVEIQDRPLLKGFRAIRNWLADTINVGKSKYAEFRSAPERPGP